MAANSSVSVFVNAEIGRELSKLVEKLTTSGESELDKDTVVKLKKLCRLSDDNVRHVYYLVMTRLEEDHAEIRFSALQIVDVLFRRSHVFRDCLVSNLQRFLELTVETDPDEPLPPPKAVAKKLNKEALECVKCWHQTFGEGYKKLVLGYNFLKDCKKINFENIDVRSIAERQREDDRLLRQDSLLKDKINCVLKEMDDTLAEMRDCVNHIESCFKLLVPDPFGSMDEEQQPCCSKSLPAETEMDPYKNNQGEDEEIFLADHGISSANYSLDIAIRRSDFTVNVTGDNQSVVDVFSEHFKILQKKYIPMVLKWTQTLGKSGQDHGGRLSLAVNIKNNLHQIVKKANLLSLHNKESEDSNDDDDFLDVEPKEGYEPVIPQHLRKEYGLEPLKTQTTTSRSTENHWTVKPRVSVEEFSDPASLAANLLKAKLNHTVTVNKSDVVESNDANNPTKKSELFSKAPKVRFDTDLLHWDEENPMPPTVVKYTSLHEFWQPFENETEEIVRPEDVAAMRERVIEFSGTFEPVKRSCRTPLPNGGLCPRHDRFKCPFHGKIIPRDATGSPSNPEDRERMLKTEEERERANPEWQDPQLLRDIQFTTGVDLTVKKGRNKKKASQGKGLADVSEKPKTTRQRLEKKVFNSASVKRVAAMLDSFDAKKYKDKFGDQFNYSYDV